MKLAIWSKISKVLFISAFTLPIFSYSNPYGYEQPEPYTPSLNSSAAAFILLNDGSAVPYLPLPQFIVDDYAPNRKIVGTTRLGLEFAVGRYIAIKENYGGITFFAVPSKSYKSIHALFDAKAFKLERKNWAGSLGFGFRWVNFDDSYIFGVNTYYDYLRENSKTYNQWGIGLEILSQNWEFRINGYLPVGKTHHLASQTIQEFLADFRLISNNTQFALKGLEVSLGGRWGIANHLSFYIAPGFYFYNSRVGNIQGIEGIAEINWHDWITFRVNTSYDSKFKGRVQGVLSINFPLDFFFCDACACPSCMSDMLARPVRRNDLIFLRDCCSVERNWDDCGLRTDLRTN